MTEIPLMDDPLGQYWRQPDKRAIEIDATHALMDRETFEVLHNYECSIPTGVYPGKMWRRDVWLCWYGPEIDGKCKVEARKILLISGVPAGEAREEART